MQGTYTSQTNKSSSNTNQWQWFEQPQFRTFMSTMAHVTKQDMKKSHLYEMLKNDHNWKLLSNDIFEWWMHTFS